jgi:Tfp pilus assembly protein PilW
MNAIPQLSRVARRLRDARALTLAEMMVATAVGALILAAVTTTYILSLRAFAAVANYNMIHADGRIAVTYFAKDMRAVSSISSFPNSSNITVTIPTAFNSSGSVTSSKTVSYTTSNSALYRLDSSTGFTDILATNINQVTFTLYDLLGNSNSVATVNAKGVQLDIHLRTSTGSRAQTEDYLSARYDMRNTLN